MSMSVIEQEKNNGSGKAKGAAKAVVSLALVACLAGSFGLNVYQARQASDQNRKVNKFIDNQLERQAKEEEKENTYEEDGYKVGNQYEIRSTTHISDAYKSGDDSRLGDKDKDTLRMAKKVLKKVIKDGMSNYEKELAVYRWMFKNISHGSGHTVALPGSQSGSYTPYDVLIGRTAVCVGYATTFRMFMKSRRIPDADRSPSDQNIVRSIRTGLRTRKSDGVAGIQREAVKMAWLAHCI